MKKSVLFLILIALGTTAQSLMARTGPPTTPVPDSGTTAAILSLSAGALVWAKRFFRK